MSDNEFDDDEILKVSGINVAALVVNNIIAGEQNAGAKLDLSKYVGIKVVDDGYFEQVMNILENLKGQIDGDNKGALNEGQIKVEK